MSVPQGSTVVNQAWFTALKNRIATAGSCAELQTISIQANVSIGGTLSAITTQLAAVQTDATNLYNAIETLISQIETLAASEGAMTAIGTVGATASSVVDLPSAIAYIKAEGSALVTLGSTNSSSFAAQIIALGKQLIVIQNDYTILSNQIESLTSQLSTIGSLLTSVNASISLAASNYPGCSITP